MNPLSLKPMARSSRSVNRRRELLAALGIVVATAAMPVPSQQTSGQRAPSVELDQKKQQAIWNYEHFSFVLELKRDPDHLNLLVGFRSK